MIQEICEYLNHSPFKNEELNKEQLSIFTPKRDLKNHRFVGLLNINVFNDIVFPKLRGDYFEPSKVYMRDFPVPNINEKTRKELEENVEWILEEHTKGSNSDDTSKLESEVDRLVYELYGLNRKEIEIIEKNVS